VTKLMLSSMILAPLVGAICQTVVSKPAGARIVAFLSSVFSALIGVFIFLKGVGQGANAEAFSEQLSWIGSYAISYELSVDGVSRIGVLLISVLFPVLLASEWRREVAGRGLNGLLLILQCALLGTLCAQDLFLLFFFWALSSIPTFFLVGVWGGEGRESAAFRALVVSAASNALFFGALILTYYSRDPHSFLIRDLVGGQFQDRIIQVVGVDLSLRGVAFTLLCLSMALRAPVWPLNGWFSKLIDEAPASVAVARSAAGVPVAVQTFARLSHLLFPTVFLDFSDSILAVGVVSVLVGAVVALGQRRLTGLFSNLVLIQVGLSLMALGSRSSSAMVGMVYQQFSAGLALAGVGLLFGILFAKFPQLSFLGKQEPSPLAGASSSGLVMGVSLCALTGVPGLSGFVGQSLILMGGYGRSPMVLLLGSVSLFLLMICLFGIYRALFLGARVGQHDDEDAEAQAHSSELNVREKAFFAPIIVAMVLLGLYPKPFLDVIRPAAETLLSSLSPPPSLPAPAMPEGSSSSVNPEKSESGT
jgi:NADH-quinone oxidoreductase subunit M